LATGSDDSKVAIWSVETGDELKAMHHNAAVKSVCFSLDGNLLASGSWDTKAIIWSVETGKDI